MIQEGLELMVLGMGVVFAFLVLLVFCMTLSGKLIVACFPDPEPVAPSGGGSPAVAASPGVSEAMIVALAAARREKMKRR